MFLFNVLKGARVGTVWSTIYKTSASVIAVKNWKVSELVLQDLAADEQKLLSVLRRTLASTLFACRNGASD